MSSKSECCSGAPRLIFACSGAADVGAIADQAARKLTQEGVGKMFCLAGVGGRVSGIMKTTEATEERLVIDGCALDCARSCLEEAGFREYVHVRVTDLDMEKGKSPATDDRIIRVMAVCKSKLNA